MNRAEALFAALFIAQVKRDGAKDPVPHIPLLGFVDKRSRGKSLFHLNALPTIGTIKFKYEPSETNKRKIRSNFRH